MRFVPTVVHGFIDYLVGVLLVALPSLLGVPYGWAAGWVPVALGIITLIYSPLTAYEWGMLKLISVPTHLKLDFASGLVLAVSPWVFGFSHLMWAPHVALGVFGMLLALLTQTETAVKADGMTAE